MTEILHIKEALNRYGIVPRPYPDLLNNTANQTYLFVKIDPLQNNSLIGKTQQGILEDILSHDENHNLFDNNIFLNVDNPNTTDDNYEVILSDGSKSKAASYLFKSVIYYNYCIISLDDLIDNIYNDESTHINEKSAAQLIKKYLENKNLKKLIIEYIDDNKILYTKLLCYQLMKLVVNSTTNKNEVDNWVRYVGIIEAQHSTFTALNTIIEIAENFFGDLASKSRTSTKVLLRADKSQKIIGFENQNEKQMIISGMLRKIIDKKIDYLIEYTKPLLSPFYYRNTDIDNQIKYILSSLKSLIEREKGEKDVDSNIKKDIRKIKESFRKTYNPRLNKKYDKFIRENIKSKPNLKYMFGVIAKLHYLEYIIENKPENKDEREELMRKIREHLFVFLISDKKIKSYDDNSSYKHYVTNSGDDIFEIFKNKDEIQSRIAGISILNPAKAIRAVLTNAEIDADLTGINPTERIGYNKTSNKNYEDFTKKRNSQIQHNLEAVSQYIPNRNNKKTMDVKIFDIQLNQYMEKGYDGTMLNPPIENIFTDRFPMSQYPVANKLYELYINNKKNGLEIEFGVDDRVALIKNPSTIDVNLTVQDSFEVYKIYSIQFLQIPDEEVLDLCGQNNDFYNKQDIYANYDILYKITQNTNSKCYNIEQDEEEEGGILKISLVKDASDNISFSLKLHTYEVNGSVYSIDNDNFVVIDITQLREYAIKKRKRKIKILNTEDDDDSNPNNQNP